MHVRKDSLKEEKEKKNSQRNVKNFDILSYFVLFMVPTFFRPLTLCSNILRFVLWFAASISKTKGLETKTLYSVCKVNTRIAKSFLASVS